MGDAYPRFTVAAVQAASVMFDREKSVDKALQCIEEAADKGAVIIGFPELFIPGHPGMWYSAKITNPLPLQGQMFKEYVKNAVKIPSTTTERLCTAAKNAHAYIIIGMAELDVLFPGTLYMTQLIISDEGTILGVHRKLVTTNTEKLVFTSGDGSHHRVFETRYGKLSVMNCGEHAHSLFKYALLAMGTQIHVASWPAFPDHISSQSHRNTVDFRVRQFAHEGKIFVINACGIFDEQNIGFCCSVPEEKVRFVADSGGGSSIISPNGDYLAEPISTGEAVVMAEICLEDALPGKQGHNVLGHYARWDIASLNFNHDQQVPIISRQSGDTASIATDLEEARREIRGLRERVDHLSRLVERRVDFSNTVE